MAGSSSQATFFANVAAADAERPTEQTVGSSASRQLDTRYAKLLTVSRPVDSLPKRKSSLKPFSKRGGTNILLHDLSKRAKQLDKAGGLNWSDYKDVVPYRFHQALASKALHPKTVHNSSAERMVDDDCSKEHGAEIQEKLIEFTDFVQTKLAAAKKEKEKSSSAIKGLQSCIGELEHKLLEVKEKGDNKIKELRVKVEAAKEEKTIAIEEKEAALGRLDAAVEEKEAAIEKLESVEKERDDALRRLECFVCWNHEHALHAFIPCGHMVCSTCKDEYTTDTPCPKCKVAIMGRLKLYN